MGRIGLEKLVAKIAEKYNLTTNQLVLIGDAALIVHGVINETLKPTLRPTPYQFELMSKGLKVIELKHPVFGKMKLVDKGDYCIITSNEHNLPTWRITEDIGPFRTETLNTVLMYMLLMCDEELNDRIDKCFNNGGFLKLGTWESDVISINGNYYHHPEYYNLLEGDTYTDGQVEWKTRVGIERVNADHIYLEYVGLMYVEPS